jgi:hypothetical protein
MKWLFLLAVTLAPAAIAADSQPLAYPNGYREWTHVKTVHLKPGHPLYSTFPGIHHVYANKKAMEGFKRGKFSNGSTLVLDLLEVREDAFATSEGPRKLVALMHKNSVRYADHAGWAFEAFKGDSRKDRLPRAQSAACFDCHAAQKKTDYVFSSFTFPVEGSRSSPGRPRAR